MDEADAKATAADDTPIGRWIDRKMQQVTNRRMLFFVLIAFLPPAFILILPGANRRFSPIIAIIGISLLAELILATKGRGGLGTVNLRLACLGWAGFRKQNWRTHLTKELVSQVVDKIVSGEADKLTQKRFRRWEDWILFSPFQYKFAWWWILIFGLCTVQVEHATYMSRSDVTVGLESPIVAELAMSPLKVMIVAVIAYIATNILREVLTLRERYAANLSQAQNLSDKLNDLRISVDRIHPLGTQMFEVLTKCVHVLGLSTRLAEFTKPVEGRSSQEQEASRRFLLTVTSQVENFLDQITKAEDERARVFVLGALNAFLEMQRQLLNTRRRRVMARFSDLALLGRELIDITLPEDLTGGRSLEFYGLMIIPPQRFLNNGRGRPVRGGATEIVGDGNWESYLKGNVDAAKRGVRQTRFFSRSSAIATLLKLETSRLSVSRTR